MRHCLKRSLRQQKKFVGASPVLKRAEEILQEQLGSDDLKTKEARLDWLVNYKQAGETITPELQKEFFELWEEVHGER